MNKKRTPFSLMLIAVAFLAIGGVTATGLIIDYGLESNLEISFGAAGAVSLLACMGLFYILHLTAQQEHVFFGKVVELLTFFMFLWALYLFFSIYLLNNGSISVEILTSGETKFRTLFLRSAFLIFAISDIIYYYIIPIPHGMNSLYQSILLSYRDSTSNPNKNSNRSRG